MDKRQLLLMGIGTLLAIAALATVVVRRDLEREVSAQMREELLRENAPPADPDAAPPGQPPAASRTLGPFSMQPDEEGGWMLFGPGGLYLCPVAEEADVRLGSAIRGRETLVVIEKECDDPCNPRSRVFLADREEPIELIYVEGLARMQDLDQDGTPELMLDRLLVGSAELVTLPLRFEGEGFVNGYKRFPDQVDRQIANLGRAAEQACAEQLSDECRGLLHALMALSLFRHDPEPAALFSRLELPEVARSWAGRSEEALRDELGELLD